MVSDNLPDSFAIGEVIAGKYRVERLLGRGGMGVVVAATHLELGELRAIKFLLSPTEANSSTTTERFLREAKAAARLKSQHVAKVYDVGSHDGAPYMVMEYLDGLPLDALLARAKRLPEGEACAMMLQAMEAIDEAHDRGIIHRDLKPANMFLARGVKNRPIVKVLDFGISKFVHPDQNLTLTRTTSFLGSPLYMSPEQMMSARDIDARADIWSLGVILYELITGRVPFKGLTIAQQSVLVVSSATPPPSDVVPDISPALETVLLRCLEKQPAERFDTVDELITALQPFGTRLPSVPAAVSTPSLESSHANDSGTSQAPREQPPSSGTLLLDGPNTSKAPVTDLPRSSHLPGHSFASLTPAYEAKLVRVSAAATSNSLTREHLSQGPASVASQQRDVAGALSNASDVHTAASWGATADDEQVSPPKRKRRLFLAFAAMSAVAVGIWAVTLSNTNTTQEDAAQAPSIQDETPAVPSNLGVPTPATSAASSTTHPLPATSASAQPSASATASAAAAQSAAITAATTKALPSPPPTLIQPQRKPTPTRKSPPRRPPPTDDPFD